MYFSSASLRTGERGGTGALAAYLAGAADTIGQSHHLVWSLFGDKNRKRDFLYRMTGTGPSQPILIYSAEQPVDRNSLWNLETKPFSLFDQLKAGDRLSWSTRVNAVRKVDSKAIDIVMDAKRNGDPDRWDVVAAKVVPAWLQKKLTAAGLDCNVNQMVVDAYNRRQFAHDPRSTGRPVTLALTDVRGIGTVTDADALRAAIAKGIGGGRAYGCGMLLIRRIA